jgi:peroxiredoxin Q/BCP
MATKKTAQKSAKKAPAQKSAKKAPAKTSAKKAAKKAPAKKVAKKAPAKEAAKKAPAKASAEKAAPTKAPAATTTGLTLGSPAPAFSLAGNDGKTHSLAAHKGRAVVLYFYPKDDTPGCTAEACAFRDHLGRATAKGAVVLGVSRDNLKSHDRFTAKYALNFPLLSDPELAAHQAYGAWGKKVMYGKEVEGTIRSTFLIDGKGVLRAAWPKVKVAGHVDEVLSALEAL